MSNHAFEKSVDGQGLYDITAQVSSAVASSGVQDGLATVFIQHTSASLLIQENADPAVQADLQNWLSRLVLENDPLYTHTQEGPDDMPAHIKGALTAVSCGASHARRTGTGRLAGRLSLGAPAQCPHAVDHRQCDGRLAATQRLSLISSIHFLCPSGSRIMLEKYCSRSLWVWLSLASIMACSPGLLLMKVNTVVRSSLLPSTD